MAIIPIGLGCCRSYGRRASQATRSQLERGSCRAELGGACPLVGTQEVGAVPSIGALSRREYETGLATAGFEQRMASSTAVPQCHHRQPGVSVFTGDR